jgi:hypothetical protein
MVANPQTPDLLPFFFGNRTEILKNYQVVNRAIKIKIPD